MADPMASVILARELWGLRRVILLPVLNPGGAGYISCPGFHGAHLPLPIDPPPAPPPARAMASVIAKRAIMPVSLLCPVSFVGGIMQEEPCESHTQEALLCRPSGREKSC